MNDTMHIILIATAAIIEIIATPLFLHYQRDGICMQSRIFKMTAASMFAAMGFLAVSYSSNTSDFAKLLLAGLISSWFGDLFLHLKQNSKSLFGIGMFFFASAHILYLVSYSKASSQYFPEKSFVTIPEIFAIAILIVILFFLFKHKGKINFFSSIMPVFFIYGLILITMFVKAASFGIQFIISGHSVFGGVFIALGGALFCSSDLTLVLLMFNEKWKKSHRLKDYNIGSYFLAQSLLALSSLFVGL